MGLPLGSLVSLPIAGWLISKFNSRVICIVAVFLYIVIIPVIGFSNSSFSLFTCLFFFGMAGDILNIAMNTQVVALEAKMNKIIMSSTLINNIAQWLQIDAFELLRKSFGGSGYDIACAQNNTPITYSIVNRIPKVEQLTFEPEFAKNIYFVYLNSFQLILIIVDEVCDSVLLKS